MSTHNEVTAWKSQNRTHGLTFELTPFTISTAIPSSLQAGSITSLFTHFSRFPRANTLDQCENFDFTYSYLTR